MTHIYYEILNVLGGLAVYYSKSYVYPSQEKILQLLRPYRIFISRRTLNYHLKALESLGYFERVRRIRKHKKTGKLHFASTLYLLKPRFFAYLRGAFKFARKIGRFFRVQRFAHYDLMGNKYYPFCANFKIQAALDELDSIPPPLKKQLKNLLFKVMGVQCARLYNQRG